MTETILAAAVAIITAPLSALLTAIFLRSKHNAEVDKLRAEVKQTLADVRGRELDNGVFGLHALVAASGIDYMAAYGVVACRAVGDFPRIYPCVLAEVKQPLADVRGRELDNDKKAIQMIMELVVEPLRKDMVQLQEKVDTLTNAIEKVNSCPHADNCPVTPPLRQGLFQSFSGVVTVLCLSL